jgi:xanthine/uracil permease
VSEKTQTQFEEALAIITIVALLLGAGTYIAAINNWPVLSPILYWVALQTYRCIPVLATYHFTQAPYVVGAIVVGGLFFCLTIPFTHVLANVFSRAGISNLEKQTARLKKHRAKLKKRRLDDDNFIVN